MDINTSIEDKEQALELMSNLAKSFNILNKEYMQRGISEKKNTNFQIIHIINPSDLKLGRYKDYMSKIHYNSTFKDNASSARYDAYRINNGTPNSNNYIQSVITQKNQNDCIPLIDYDFNVTISSNVSYYNNNDWQSGLSSSKTQTVNLKNIKPIKTYSTGNIQLAQVSTSNTGANTLYNTLFLNSMQFFPVLEYSS